MASIIDDNLRDHDEEEDGRGDHSMPVAETIGAPSDPSLVEQGSKTKVGAATEPPSSFAALLNLHAYFLDQLEALRIASENQLRAIQQAGGAAPVSTLEMIDSLSLLESRAVLNLKRQLRKHPLSAWQRRTLGIGEKTLARFIAVVSANGDPSWNAKYERQRTLAELRAFCGMHVVGADSDQADGEDQISSVGVAPRRRKGHVVNWSTTAKTRLFLMAEPCIKNRNSAYRPVYDAAREKYAEAIHLAPCLRCGPKGKPAQVGSPLSDGHKHARGIRMVMRAILHDVYRESLAVSSGASEITTPASG